MTQGVGTLTSSSSLREMLNSWSRSGKQQRPEQMYPICHQIFIHTYDLVSHDPTQTQVEYQSQISRLKQTASPNSQCAFGHFFGATRREKHTQIIKFLQLSSVAFLVLLSTATRAGIVGSHLTVWPTFHWKIGPQQTTTVNKQCPKCIAITCTQLGVDQLGFPTMDGKTSLFDTLGGPEPRHVFCEVSGLLRFGAGTLSLP